MNLEIEKLTAYIDGMLCRFDWVESTDVKGSGSILLSLDGGRKIVITIEEFEKM